MQQAEGRVSCSPFIPLAAVVCIAVAIAGVFLGVLHTRHEAAEATCMSHVEQLGFALHSYHEKYGHFPPAFICDATGRRLHSWRVLILEFLDTDLYHAYDFGEPWDGPNNRQLAHKMPPCFACPNAPETETLFHTSYVVVTGLSTLFPGPTATRLGDVSDDKSSTLMVVETANSDIHWMEPRDLDLRTMSFKVNDATKPSISASGRRGPVVFFADGTHGRLRTDLHSDGIRAMLTISGGESVDLSKVLQDY